MNWKESSVIRILLLVAQLLAPAEWAAEVKSLATHIQYGKRETS